MRCERFALDGDPAALATQLRRLVPAPESVGEAVAEIIAQVRAHGDTALLDYVRRFDMGGGEPGALGGDEPAALRVTQAELDEAERALDPSIRQGLQAAVENVRRVAETARHEDHTATFDTHQVTVREVPVDRAAVYVPGGRAPYPSTVVMGVVAARVAGVPEVVVCSPPDVHPAILGACALTGASAVYRMGGAHAIAALAHGTESIEAVDVIVGPGNLYVQEAKRQVSGEVGIDGFAGPSDLLVIADATADPDLVALDLLAQAEHGPGTLVVAVSEELALLDAVQRSLHDAPETGATCGVVQTADVDEALGLAQAFAPEHIQLVGPAAEALAGRITHAGCVFVGRNSGTAFGDYIAGSNHVLPTNGAARFASALTPAHFRRRFTEVRISEPAPLATLAAPVARAEGFEVHARSMEARIRDNGTDGANR